MIWRTIAIALTFSMAVRAGEPKWNYIKLVDAPLAPSERSTSLKIIKVCADQGPAADSGPPASTIENAVCVTPEHAGDLQLKSAPGTWRAFVGGEVHRTGSFTATKPFTALQAVIAAGGPKELGATEEVVVLR